MSVGNISFILMKSSFTIYKDIQTANRKYTQTHVNEVLEGFTVTKYREKLLVITQFRTHVWFCSAQYWGQGAREGRQGWARVGAYRGWCPLSGSSFSEYRSTDYIVYCHPPAPSALPLAVIVFTRPATCNTQLTAERESVTSTMTEITLQPSSNYLENYQ